MNANFKWQTRILSVCVAGFAAMALAFGAPTAMAQGHGGSGKGGGHDSGSTSHDDGHSSHEGGRGSGRGGKGERESGRGKGGGHGSLRDVFREMEDEAAAEKGKKGAPHSKAPSAEKGKGSSQAKKGQKTDRAVAEEEDSDRPAWAGKNATEPKPGRPSTESGTKKGDIYGDLYVILRNPDGTPVTDGGYVKVYFVNPADGSLVCCIVRDEAGDLTTTGAIEGTDTVVENVVPIEVELGRLSVGRSPDRVLAAQLEDVISAINAADSLSTDLAGRIVLTTTVDGVATVKTIDSSVANLAIYTELLKTGTIAGVTDTTKLAAIGIDTLSAVSKDELLAAASFFAAASDKTIPITIDSVIYMNTILGIEGVSFNVLTDYSRSTEYTITDPNLQPEVLQDPDGDGDWTATKINPYEIIFKSTDPSDIPTTQDTDDVLTSAEAFTIAADDARTVIDFLHTYPVPSN